MKVVSRTVRGNAGFSDVKTLTIRCWDFRTIRLIFMRKPQYLHSFYMPPDPGSMQSSPDSILASLQPSNAECVKDSSLPSTGSEGEGTDGETTGVMEMAFLWFSKIIFHSGNNPRSKTPQNIPPSVYDKGMCPTMVIFQNMQTTDWFVSDPYWEFRYSLSHVRVLRFLTSFFEQISILSSESNAGLHWFCLTVIGLENVCYSFYQSNT